MSSIPANLFAQVTPSVLSVGGTALDITALVLTNNTRVPIGTVASFSSVLAVSSFFGATSQEAIIAGGGLGKGSGYFGGFTNSNKLPATLLFAQYNTASVAAYLRGGNISALPLATLQGYSGNLGLTINGSLTTASISLASATSFSNVAQIINNGLLIQGAQAATLTGSIGASGTGGGAGTTLTVTALASGTLGVGQVIQGTGVTLGTYIVSQLTGAAGGTGTYQVNTSQSALSAAMTAFAPAVTYDSVSGAFTIASSTTGSGSTITFGSGALATNLLLTLATGAVLSQGTGAAVPATFMNNIITLTTNWVTFMTAFDPDGGSGNTVKQAFAAWKNGQNNRYAYVCWDTDASPRSTVPATASLGQVLAGNGDSGTFVISELTDLNMAAFVCGAAASIDFTQTNGRTTFAFRNQPGLVADVTDPTTAINLGGDPRVAGSFGNGYNYFGAVGAANQNFNWLQRGTVTGAFTWFDSYINQIWLNNGFQIALLNLQNNAKSIPYTTSGAALIESALQPQIAAGLNFGAFAPGTISASQIAAVSAQAGANIATTLQTQGYYLQILQAASTARASRTTPPCTFWYLDRGSIQSLALSSVALQ
jgi:hypothetical protein